MCKVNMLGRDAFPAIFLRVKVQECSRIISVIYLAKTYVLQKVIIARAIIEDFVQKCYVYFHNLSAKD